MLLVAACLRPAITSVGPLLGDIAKDAALGELRQGLLGAIPLVMFAVCSPLAGMAARPKGMEFAVLTALAVLAVGIVVRSVGGGSGLWIGTALAGAAVAVANVLTPALIKRDFAKAALTMAVFTTVLSGFAAIASGTAVPLSDALGGWRPALLSWVLLPVVVGSLWVWRSASVRDKEKSLPAPPRAASIGLLIRSPGAWQVTVFFGLQSATFYTVVTWLPSIEHSFGVDDRMAGVHLLVYQVLGSACGLVIGVLMERTVDQRLAAVGISVPVVVAMLGLAVAPHAALVWVVLAAAGAGAALTVALALVVLRSTTSEETAALSAMAQSVGYLIAALGPLGAGLLADLWGWRAVLFSTAGVAACQSVLALWAGRTTPVGDRTRERCNVGSG
ncbi:MFS transporter [Nocardioides aquiterrae]|uniref:MFS transporter n=1 Tax=Nocardioides aquiterrae TaxID=203799 RepID=A0ABP4F0F0_9ACTN